jgi:hypothetical protein
MYINFHPKKITQSNLFIRLKEVFLQKNGKAGHIIEVKPFNKPASEVFVWKDSRDVSHVDGDMKGLSSTDLLTFLQSHEYKREHSNSCQAS